MVRRRYPVRRPRNPSSSCEDSFSSEKAPLRSKEEYRMRECIDFIHEHKNFYILSHEEPDGDCIGSSLALGSFLKRLGKKAVLLSPGPFSRNEIKRYEKKFQKEVDTPLSPKETAVFVLDCSTPERIGFFQEFVKPYRVGVIDHHGAGKEFGDVRWIDPKAPSVTYLVQLLQEHMGFPPNKTEAEHLLFGLCTDTGFFRHCEEDQSETFAAASRLLAAGASPNKIYQLIFGGRELGTRLLLGKDLVRTEEYFEGRLLITFETLGDLKEFGGENRDSDTLYSLLQTVTSAEVVVLIREESQGVCSAGLRASGNVNVGEIARAFGGGGHPKASGFEWRGERAALREELLRGFSEVFP